MKIQEIENAFLDMISKNIILQIEKKRTDNAILVVSVRSSCDEIGLFSAYIQESEITLSCNVTHTHINRNDFLDCEVDEAVERMVSHAAKQFLEFIKEEVYVSKSLNADGKLISSGWLSASNITETLDILNSGFSSLHQGPCLTKIWSWSGEIVKF